MNKLYIDIEDIKNTLLGEISWCRIIANNNYYCYYPTDHQRGLPIISRQVANSAPESHCVVLDARATPGTSSLSLGP